MSSSKKPKKVLIVGAGPTGLTSALELARRDIVPTVIDAKAGIDLTSRATGLSVKSLELLEASGVTPRLIAAGNKVKSSKVMQEKGRGITLNFNELAHKYNFLLCLPQNRTEEIMQKRFEELGGNVEYDTHLVSLNQTKDGTVEVVMEKNGKRRTEIFDTVIGADGVNSTVRDQMDIRFKEKVYPSKWSAAEFDCKNWPHKTDEIQYFIGKGGKFAVVVPLGDDRYRAVANTDDAMSCIFGNQSIDKLHFNTAFDVSERHVKTYQKVGVFLAGDAAHTYAPAGVQGGMNLGIRDACSLARRVAEGDTKGYTRERKADGAATIRDSSLAVRVAGFSNIFMKAARNMTVGAAMRFKALRQKVLKKSLGA